MKSDRRHELQQNALDSELGKLLSFLKRRGNQILTILLVVGVIATGIYYVRKRAAAQKAETRMQYDQYLQSRAPIDERISGLRTLADQDDDKWVAAMSCVQVGNLCLVKSLQADMTSPARKELLDEAEGWYRRAIERFADENLAVAKARLGLAKLAEDRGDLQAAEREYQAVSNVPGMTGQPALEEARAAMERLAALKGPVAMAASRPAPASQPESQPASASQPAEE